VFKPALVCQCFNFGEVGKFHIVHLAVLYCHLSRVSLVKLDIEGNKAAHHSYIFAKEKGNKKEIGFVTSAAWSPDFETNVAIGMIRMTHWNPGTEVEVDTPDGMRPATIRDSSFI